MSVAARALALIFAGAFLWVATPSADAATLIGVNFLAHKWQQDMAVGGVTRTVRDPANTNFSGTYGEDTGAGGNYARFDGLTADVLTVKAWPQVDKRAALNGIQVIHAPEPATAGLVATGLAALVWRRRRRLRKAA